MFTKNYTEEKAEDYTDAILCSVDTNFLSLQNWHLSPNTFCAIAIDKISELCKIEEVLLKEGFEKTKTEGTYCIKGDYALCSTGNMPTDIILRKYK